MEFFPSVPAEKVFLDLSATLLEPAMLMFAPMEPGTIATTKEVVDADQDLLEMDALTIIPPPFAFLLESI